MPILVPEIVIKDHTANVRVTLESDSHIQFQLGRNLIVGRVEKRFQHFFHRRETVPVGHRIV